MFKNVYLDIDILKLEIMMEASIIDLRYKMKDVQKALQRNEIVKVTYHGKLIGNLKPVDEPSELKVEAHPFFGMLKNAKKSVADMMKELRGGRYNDI